MGALRAKTQWRFYPWLYMFVYKDIWIQFFFFHTFPIWSYLFTSTMLSGTKEKQIMNLNCILCKEGFYFYHHLFCIDWKGAQRNVGGFFFEAKHTKCNCVPRCKKKNIYIYTYILTRNVLTMNVLNENIVSLNRK